MTRKKSAKPVRFAITLMSVLVIYVGLSFVWWHPKIQFAVHGPADPFADPLPVPDTPGEYLLFLGDRAFFDFKGWYDKITDPMRPRRDPDGNSYFAEGRSKWYTPYLYALNRNSLYERDEADTATYYRFTTIPSY